jgi:hypothetical protein
MADKIKSVSTYDFNVSEYYALVETIIQRILSRHENDNLTYDILDTELKNLGNIN